MGHQIIDSLAKLYWEAVMGKPPSKGYNSKIVVYDDKRFQG